MQIRLEINVTKVHVLRSLLIFVRHSTHRYKIIF